MKIKYLLNVIDKVIGPSTDTDGEYAKATQQFLAITIHRSDSSLRRLDTNTD